MGELVFESKVKSEDRNEDRKGEGFYSTWPLDGREIATKEMDERRTFLLRELSFLFLSS